MTNQVTDVQEGGILTQLAPTNTEIPEHLLALHISSVTFVFFFEYLEKVVL